MRSPLAGAGLLRAAVLGLAVLAMTPAAWSQTAGLPSELISSKTALTDAQKGTLAKFVEKTATAVSTGQPAEVVFTRNELVNLCKNKMVSEIFRRELSVGLVKAFAPLTKSTDTFRATNAFIIAGFLRTPEALDFLVDNVDPASQADAGLRMVAAAQLPSAAPDSNLSPPQIDAVSKRLAGFAKAETNWMAIASEVTTIGEMLRTKMPAAQAISVAEAQASIINSLTERLASGKSPELCQALQRSLLEVRDQASSIPAAVQGKLLQSIQPSLETITKMGSDQPDWAKASPALQTSFDSVKNTTKVLQRLGAGNV